MPKTVRVLLDKSNFESLTRWAIVVQNIDWINVEIMLEDIWYQVMANIIDDHFNKLINK